MGLPQMQKFTKLNSIQQAQIGALDAIETTPRKLMAANEIRDEDNEDGDGKYSHG